MADPKYIRINSYSILDEDLNVLASNLVMDEDATIEDNGVVVAYVVEGGPLVKPQKARI